MNGGSAEGDQGSSSGGTSAVSNLTVRSKWKEAPSDGVVNGQAPFSMKRRKHISNERQRRVHMNNLLESLQKLLPDSKPRTDRCTLLIDVIDYLRSLEDKTRELATRKEAIMTSLTQTKTITKPGKVATLAMSSHQLFLQNVNVEVIKSHKPMNHLQEMIITFTSLHIKGIFSQILMLFNINQIEIINATFSTTLDDQMLHFIHAQVPKDLNIESDDLKAILSTPSQISVYEEHIA